MRTSRLAIVLSAALMAAACSDDTNNTSVIDARLTFDARPGIDGSTATVDARPAIDAAAAGLDAPIATLDAPITVLDAPVAELDAAPATIDAATDTIDALAGAPDAATVNIPDITGTFLFAINVNTSVGALPNPTELIATVTLNPAGASPTVSVHFQFLTISGRTLIEADQADFTNVSVDPGTNKFTLTTDAITIPAAANSLGIDVMVTTVSIPSTIQSATAFCGTVDGTAHVGANAVPLTGSTFGAVHANADDTGADLPTAVTACPASKRAR